VGNAPNLHVSKHHLEGSLADVQLEKILESCHRHLVTGLIRITAGPKSGTIELRAGAVEQASFDGASGNLAIAKMHALLDGTYEIVQRLPDLAGELGGAASAEGEVSGVPLIKAMQHCEHNALTCVITVIAGFDRAQIKYRLGEVVGIEKNGVADDDAIVEILKWTDARFRIEAPPLELDIEASPRAKADPTRPFVLHKEKHKEEETKEEKAEAKAKVEERVEERLEEKVEERLEEKEKVEEEEDEAAAQVTPSTPVEAAEPSPPPRVSAGWWMVTVVFVLLAAGAAAVGVWLSMRDRGPAPAARPDAEPAATPLPPPVDAAPAPPVDAAAVPPLDAAGARAAAEVICRKY
jgi:hypothetical protein